jgi:hypothetical protein
MGCIYEARYQNPEIYGARNASSHGREPPLGLKRLEPAHDRLTTPDALFLFSLTFLPVFASSPAFYLLSRSFTSVSMSLPTIALTGKVAIVTGGSRGIGAGIATALAARGAHVVLTYASSTAQADAVVAAIVANGGRALAVQADCREGGAADAVVAAATGAFGPRIDIVVNNAGAGDEMFLADITMEHLEKVFRTNVFFPTMLVQACLPYLQKGGRIVNISSIVARQGEWDGRLGWQTGMAAAAEGDE